MDGDDMAICNAVVDMGHALGLKVIAEGVETTEQLAVLRELGCDVGQGFLFARPMPPDAFLAFVLLHEGDAATAFGSL
jgi:EAL domain-containing protein (putative c-di-GMP-specific phosphodiesterase class I)